MAVFYPLRVKETRKETKDAVSIKFEVPEAHKHLFEYQHGQYLTIRVVIDGKKHHRAYSLCSSPVVDRDPVVTSKRVVDGLVSNYLYDNLEEGDTLEVFPPMGKFTIDLHPDNKRTYVLFGGGSGITPLMSILKTVLHVESASSVYLFYGNYDEEAIIFKQELEELSRKYGDRFHMVHTLSHPGEDWDGEKGMMDRGKTIQLLEQYGLVNDEIAEFFICGPSAMMEQVKTALTEKEIPKDKVHIEYFSAPLPDLNEEQEKILNIDGQGDDESVEFEEAEVTILLDGQEHVIRVTPEEKILDVALDEDLDPPYACQMGICTTCKAFLHEGKVEMEENEGLTDQEVEEGYILSCQSHPRTAKIRIEYE